MAEAQGADQARIVTSAQPPKLSLADFKIYNSMADHMELFHNHFRDIWTTVYKAAASGKRPEGMTIRQFLNMGLDFSQKLHFHHTIEERHIFPVLAKKMPAFRKELELLEQHKEIHKGLDKFQSYLTQCVAGERELRLSELKELMDDFGSVLWAHLTDEVVELGAENMSKYWTLQEMRAMPL